MTIDSRRFLAGVLALGCALLAPASAANAPGGSPIVIGAVLALTGPFAPIGEPNRNALQLFEKQINARGGINGHPVQIDILDDEGKPDTAAQLAQQFVGRNVPIIIGGSTTPETAAMIRVTTDKALQIYMSPTPLWDAKTGVVKQLFEATPRVELEAKVMLPFAKSRLRASKIAILHDENQYGTYGANLVANEASANGLTVVANESYPTAATDVTGQLQKIKSSGADTIVLWGASPATALIARQIKQQGLSANVLGSAGILSDNFLRVAGKDGDGVYSNSNLNYTHPTPDQRTFLADYRAAYKATATNFAAYAYDAASLAVLALRKAGGKTDVASLESALETMAPYRAVTTTIKMTPSDHNGMTTAAIHMAQDRNGVWFTL